MGHNLINKKHRKDKKLGQIQVTFNWLYVLLAGGVILLFFAGIVVNQKENAEKSLSVKIIEDLDSIFTGAYVSDKTQGELPTAGLRDYTFTFECSEGVTEYGILDRGVVRQENLIPIFSPREIKTEKMYWWSIPYKFPFPIINLLIITSENTKYYLLGDLSFAQAFIDDVKKFNLEHLSEDQYPVQVNPTKNYQVRIIDLDGKLNQDSLVPVGLHYMDNDKVSMVSFSIEGVATYYEMVDNSFGDKTWSLIDSPVKVISLGGEFDSAKYAAIFSATPMDYKCGMQKVFKRMKYVAEIYLERFKEIKNYHESNPNDGDCVIKLQNRETFFILLKSQAESCETSYGSDLGSCLDLLKTAKEIKDYNEELELLSCLNIY